ncbi:hypothetical protein [Hoeflea sp.]
MRWPPKSVEVTDSNVPNSHMIAGDALSPVTTELLAAEAAL